MSIPKAIDFKRGATFSEAGFLPEGTLYDDGNWTVKAQAVGAISGVRHDLTARLVAPVAPETRYLLHLSAPASKTVDWAVEKLRCDVQFLDLSAEPEPFKASSRTFVINVIQDVTQ